MSDTNSKLVVGVDLGGTNVRAGVVNQKHKVLACQKKKTKPDKGEQNVVDRIVGVVNEAITASGVDRAAIAGLGIGAPGAVDVEKGVIINAVNLRWKDYPLAKVLEKAVGMPVVVDNDVNVGTWGEKVAGAAQDYDNMLGVFVGTGIGGALVLEGKLYHGYHFTAGEIGHIVIHPGMPPGRRTLENLASRTALASTLTDLIRSNHASAITELIDGNYDNLRSKAIAKAYDQKDDLTVRVVNHTARYLGLSIANIVTVMSLPCVVVGGGFAEAMGKTWLARVRDAFEECVFPTELRQCAIVAGTLGDDAGVIGAADLAGQRLGIY